jgi:hypothetical protein
MMDLKTKKAELERQLQQLKEAEEIQKIEEIRKDNYKQFQNRCVDWIIGRAHCQFELQDNGWHQPKGETLPFMPTTITINGNCSRTYCIKAQVTSSTNMYFHNTIPSSYQTEFRNEIMKVVHRFVDKIYNNASTAVELLGLQSLSDRLINESFLEEDVEKVKEEITAAQDEVLNRFPLVELETLARSGKVSHGGAILRRHIDKRAARLARL